jgi:hypothetical protein
MASKPLEYIEKLAVQKPALAEDLAELGSLYQRKLWHQLTLKLEELYAKPDFCKGDLPVALYNGFVADFGSKLNLLRLAHLAVAASKSLADPAAAAAFLTATVDKLAEWKLPRSEEPSLYLRMHVAEKQLEMGAIAECKAAIEDGAAALERLPDPDPSVSAVVHYVSSLYYKLKKDYAKFYRSSMQVIAPPPRASLTQQLRRRACWSQPQAPASRPVHPSASAADPADRPSARACERPAPTPGTQRPPRPTSPAPNAPPPSTWHLSPATRSPRSSRLPWPWTSPSRRCSGTACTGLRSCSCTPSSTCCRAGATRG